MTSENGTTHANSVVVRGFDDLDEDRVLEEVDDSAPLLFQLSWALNGRSVDTGTEQ